MAATSGTGAVLSCYTVVAAIIALSSASSVLHPPEAEPRASRASQEWLDKFLTGTATEGEGEGEKAEAKFKKRKGTHFSIIGLGDN